MNSLRARYRAPSHRARKKVINRLDTHCQAFIAHSPFVVIGTSAADDGSGDVVATGRLSMGGKPALMAIRVEIREAYLHCNRAIRRARLWDEDSRPDRAILPGAGRMINEMTNLPGDPAEAERTYIEGTRELY